MKKIKKTDIALIVGVVLVILLGCFVMKGNKEEEIKYDLPLKLSGNGELVKLSYEEYQKKIDDKESFVVIIERKTCSHCQNFMPVAEKFAKDNKLPMYYIDTDEMEEADWTKLEKSTTFFKEKGDNWGTPTTLVQVGKQTVDYIEGETTAKNLLKTYKKYFDVDAYKNNEN